MKDIYLMNKKTGELKPSKQVFKDFYKNNEIFESVFDEWEKTKFEVENSEVVCDFVKILNI